jgi:D-alanyl-D-alanine carboxypeptidase
MPQLAWTNTNKLLGSAALPCDGIKTGTTRAAGPCLCSRLPDALNPQRSIIVVVMGYVTIQVLAVPHWHHPVIRLNPNRNLLVLA